ncbi:MAG: hypothetical protein R2822_13310 [Spirosomataceae bacterium]
MQNTKSNRRDFLRISGLSGAAFILGISNAKAANSVESLYATSLPIEPILDFEFSPHIIIENRVK